MVRAHPGGFFSNFNKVVSYLHHELGHDGIAAVRVDWRVPEDPGHFVFGTAQDGNVWERFFEPLAFPRFPEAVRYGDDFVHPEMTNVFAYDYYRREGWQADLHRTYSRHIRVRPELLARLDALLPARARVLRIGVHYRHPEHSVETPSPIGAPEHFIARVRELVGRRWRWSVVLATDVEEAVDAFRAAFGKRLVIQPGVVRARAATAEPMHHRGDVRDVALGEQVLLDALMLARCDALVHITSNVATAAGFMNPRLRMVYCEP